VYKRQGQTIKDSTGFTVEPGKPTSLSIVLLPDSKDIANDTLSSNILDKKIVHQYAPVIKDANGNLVTKSSALTNVTWIATDNLDSISPYFIATGSLLSYNATGIKTFRKGQLICKTSTLADTINLVIFSTLSVTRVSTHEWIPDTLTTGALSIDSVLSKVFDVSITGLSTAKKLDTLRTMGYTGELDGYLDYLNFELSNSAQLSEGSIDSIWAPHPGLSGDSNVTVWHGTKKMGSSANKVIAHYLKLLPLNSSKTAYRIWLKPSYKFRTLSGSQANPTALETGYKPLIRFNNTIIKADTSDNGLNIKQGVQIGVETRHTISGSVVKDSASPVISKVVFSDNRCNPDNRVSSAEIYFSEPVRPLSSVVPGWKVALTRAFSSRTQETIDTSVCSNPRIVESIVEGSTEIGLANKAEAENFSPTNSMMFVRVMLKDTIAAINLFGTGAAIRLTEFPQPSQIRDLSENGGNQRPNHWVSVESNKPVNQPVCEVAAPTLVNRNEMMTFSYSNGIPNFYWVGPTLTNPLQAPEGKDSVLARTLKIRLSIYIFDLLGNLVASPDINKCLQAEIPYKEIFEMKQGSNTYTSTKNMDYSWLKQKTGESSNHSPCGVLPAWNGLNNNGRLVAPGGYIVKLTVFNGLSSSTEPPMRMIVTNKKVN